MKFLVETIIVVLSVCIGLAAVLLMGESKIHKEGDAKDG